ncbi:hypothetical protein LMG31506_02532 [Cupriavidus yeoncheonensis]|uniref:Uncharacterized protein n=1 Tax=Cupriavidus yeoncheonensis TaxID=1462994 RepID=A0A916ITS6_9BURK|nr:hypothetical protein LMG31506_02532 [Cupriavidus yeoncheonensis]
MVLGMRCCFAGVAGRVLIGASFLAGAPVSPAKPASHFLSKRQKVTKERVA